MVSHAFAPGIGGTETIGGILAEEFSRRGNEVRVVTQTPGQADAGAYPVIRSPNRRQLFELVKWSDICFHNHISVKMAWPLVFVKRPWVVVHHTWIEDGKGLKDALKRFLLRFSRSIAVSDSIAQALNVPANTIGNAYRDDLFREIGGIQRDLDIVYLGRLVTDKGVDILLSALKRLQRDGLHPRVSIIGEGPERERLGDCAIQSGMGEQVRFLGARTGDELVRLLNQHKIMVIPSRWREPFGIVALEGIACGCVAVGSSGGGLTDAIGPCGLTFPNGDADALAGRLKQLLEMDDLRPFRARATEHLSRHSRSVVADAYLKTFREILA